MTDEEAVRQGREYCRLVWGVRFILLATGVAGLIVALYRFDVLNDVPVFAVAFTVVLAMVGTLLSSSSAQKVGRQSSLDGRASSQLGMGYALLKVLMVDIWRSCYALPSFRRRE